MLAAQWIRRACRRGGVISAEDPELVSVHGVAGSQKGTLLTGAQTLVQLRHVN